MTRTRARRVDDQGTQAERQRAEYDPEDEDPEQAGAKEEPCFPPRAQHFRTGMLAHKIEKFYEIQEFRPGRTLVMVAGHINLYAGGLHCEASHGIRYTAKLMTGNRILVLRRLNRSSMMPVQWHPIQL